MKVATVISGLGFLAMLGIILYGFAVGDFLGEGARLAGMPWGQVSLVDLYVGFTLFSMWIVYRERSLGRSVLWVVLMMALGNLTASLYVFLALRGSGGEWRRFFMGRHAP